MSVTRVSEKQTATANATEKKTFVNALVEANENFSVLGRISLLKPGNFTFGSVSCAVCEKIALAVTAWLRKGPPNNPERPCVNRDSRARAGAVEFRVVKSAPNKTR